MTEELNVIMYVSDVSYLYTMKFNEFSRNNEMVHFAVNWLELEYMLREISQKKEKHRMISLICYMD